MSRWIEYAVEEYNEIKPLCDEIYPTDLRYKEETIIEKIRAKKFAKPKTATHVRFLYGNSLLAKLTFKPYVKL